MFDHNDVLHHMLGEGKWLLGENVKKKSTSVRFFLLKQEDCYESLNFTVK